MTSDSSVQKKMDVLSQKMAWFHGEQFNLDEAATRYKEVEILAEEIEAILKKKKNEVEVLNQKFDS